jgi:uncharacterized protein (TIGR00369 family)
MAADDSVPGRFDEQYDERVAQGLARANEVQEGLTAFLGARIVEVAPGRLVAELAVRDELLTPFGTLHGGVMAALVDHVLGVVLYPLIPRGAWAATTEFKLNYLAPVREGMLRAEANVLTLSRRTAVVRAEVTNGDDLVGAAQGTLLIVIPRD